MELSAMPLDPAVADLLQALEKKLINMLSLNLELSFDLLGNMSSKTSNFGNVWGVSRPRLFFVFSPFRLVNDAASHRAPYSCIHLICNGPYTNQWCCVKTERLSKQVPATSSGPIQGILEHL